MEGSFGSDVFDRVPVLAWRDMTPQEVPESWESYPAFVDDAPAMFLLNMGLVERAPIAEASTLYLIKVEMAEPGEHGLGTAAEAERFMPFEDAVCAATTAAGLYTAGRVRTGGHWEMGFYGAEGVDLSEVLDGVGEIVAEFEIMIGGGDDPEWDFLLGYLAPDRERWQWIMDARVVRQLEEHGDDAEKPRPVDHALHFATEDALATFVKKATELGYRESQRKQEDGRELPWMVEVVREDPVTVDEIHDAVMELMTIAEELGGDYDGWGCPVTQ